MYTKSWRAWRGISGRLRPAKRIIPSTPEARDAIPEKRGAVDVLAIGGRPPLIKVNRTGPAATVLALWVKKTSVSKMPNGQRDESDLTVEVTELFEGQLDRALFEPPPGFQRVISLPGNFPLPWGQQMRLRWEWIEDWFSGLFT